MPILASQVPDPLIGNKRPGDVCSMVKSVTNIITLFKVDITSITIHVRTLRQRPLAMPEPSYSVLSTNE